MMNTLANHYFIPHNGKNLTRDVATKGLQDALHFDPDLTEIMFEQALPANPLPNATWFDLYAVKTTFPDFREQQS